MQADIPDRCLLAKSNNESNDISNYFVTGHAA